MEESCVTHPNGTRVFYRDGVPVRTEFANGTIYKHNTPFAGRMVVVDPSSRTESVINDFYATTASDPNTRPRPLL